MTASGVADGWCCRYSAAAPVTCGAAIEVLPSSWVAVWVECQVETMFAPGANRSTQPP